MELIVFIATNISQMLENRNLEVTSVRSARMEFVRFLIMENLSFSGEFCDIDNLRCSVTSDLLSMKKPHEKDIFDITLEKLNEEQFIFINRGKNKVAATQYGITRSS
tara:strand:- start:115 stop:435 length:321 start_codon:yes stop_codon:yes gene_type:complete